MTIQEEGGYLYCKRGTQGNETRCCHVMMRIEFGDLHGKDGIGNDGDVSCCLPLFLSKA